jgi:hypothetical protein
LPGLPRRTRCGTPIAEVALIDRRNHHIFHVPHPGIIGTAAE